MKQMHRGNRHGTTSPGNHNNRATPTGRREPPCLVCRGLRFPVVALAVLGLSISCAEPTGRVAGPGDGRSDISVGPTVAASELESASLGRIARLVAMALNDKHTRNQLKKDLRAAPFKEHKVELRKYLESSDVAPMLDRMAQAGGQSKKDILATLGRIRPLELYMPVRSQREKWVGDEDVLVAAQLAENDPIVGFDSRGEPVALDKSAAPTRPTLSIVPVETRFDSPMPMGRYRNINDQNGDAIGTLVPADLKASKMMVCDEACSGGGGEVVTSPPALPPGLYLEFSRILDLHETWNRGDPEIEVHIHGPIDPGNPRYGADLSCSGEHAYDSRKSFDQNDGFWEGHVMLFSGQEAVDFVNKFHDGFHIFFWEDDDTACKIKADNNALLGLIRSTATAFGTVAVKLLPLGTWPIVAGAFVAVLFQDPAAWLLTNDDFVGAAVAQSAAGYSYPNNTHVIMDGTTLNGRATIVYHP